VIATRGQARPYNIMHSAGTNQVKTLEVLKDLEERGLVKREGASYSAAPPSIEAVAHIKELYRIFGKRLPSSEVWRV
jgi:sugar-specific transcriptional regulator TrmB